VTLNELIERAQEMVEQDESLGEREVYFVYQRSYPLQSTVRGLCTSEEADNEPPVIYVVEGSQVRDHPYGPRNAFDVAY
jgi:hypothetical protein